MIVKLAAQDYESIYQSIRTILLTEKGSVPFRPNMGVGSAVILDGKLDRMKISLEIIDQINTYEPRVTVKQVLFREGDTVASLTIAIHYKIKETGEEKAYYHNN